MSRHTWTVSLGTCIRLCSPRASGVFGLTCVTCGCKDAEQDNVKPEMKRMWGYQAQANGKNLGSQCWVCLKVLCPKMSDQIARPSPSRAGWLRFAFWLM